MSATDEGGQVDTQVLRLAEQRDMMRRSADSWRGRATVAESTIAAVRKVVDAWNTEGLGHAPGTNYPDAWADLNRLLDGADTGHGDQP